MGTPDEIMTPEEAQRFQDSCVAERQLVIWTVTTGTTDYPGRYAARPGLPQISVNGLRSVLLADTLEELREMLPRGLYRQDRQPGDYAVIVETWF